MNDPVVTTISAKTLLCVILAVGAVLCVVYGYRMFNHHANPQGSRMILNAFGLKVTAQGAGERVEETVTMTRPAHG
jgi:hypothetical protein